MQGAIPISWDQAIATKRLSKPPHCVIWSPCSQFIAISLYSIPTIQILDAATLKLLKSFTTTHDHIKLFAFSSKSHLLTCLGDGLQVIISWDLQTGVQVGQVPMGEHWSSLSPHSITHSRCGTMFGVLYGSAYFATTIVTYSILSSAHIHEHSINGLLLGTIWTHGECLQFATLGSESLTIWEVEFSSKCPPTEVKSLLIPKNPGPYMSFFLPNLSRLVFINQDSLFIWDAQHSKLLLDTVVRECGKMSFSSDGHTSLHVELLVQKFTSGRSLQLVISFIKNLYPLALNTLGFPTHANHFSPQIDKQLLYLMVLPFSYCRQQIQLPLQVFHPSLFLEFTILSWGFHQIDHW